MKYIFKIITLTLIIFTATNASSTNKLRISANELINNINYIKTKNNINAIILIDTRSEDLYDQGHIKNALNFPISKTFENLSVDGKIVNPIKFGKIARELGLKKDSEIVIYDGGSFFDSSRLFWTLEVYGFTNVKLLSNSYSYWQMNHFPISDTIRKIIKSDYISTIDNTKLATKFATQIAIENPRQIIIDARGTKGYTGEVSTALRFGHIPKAINLPAQHNIKKFEDGTSSLHDISKLEKLYSNLDKKKKVIIYCEVGKLSSTNYFVMRELGFNVANYDSSWKEWGNEFYLPIIKPKNKI